MKPVSKYYNLCLLIVFAILLIPQLLSAQQNNLSADEKKIYSKFKKEVKKYSKLREKMEKRLPKLSKDATAEQIEVHKITFQKSVQTVRADAIQGNIFNPTAAEVIRNVVKREFQGKDRAEPREMVFEAETQGVPLKINFPYPESKEQIEMPPELLLNLPKLPKQLRFRFVGKNLLLVDRENGLIIDYMTNAVPPMTKTDVALQKAEVKAEAKQEKQNNSTTAPSVSPPVVSANEQKTTLPLTLPLRKGSVRFLAIGDTGRGNKEQNELARLMFDYRKVFPYEFIIMTGDNIYGSDNAKSLKTEFEDVYKILLNDGVKFYASLGNHDGSNQRFYEFFNRHYWK